MTSTTPQGEEEGRDGEDADWVAPTEAEAELHAAILRNDADTFHETLAAQQLYIHVSKEDYDREGDECSLLHYPAPDGGHVYLLYTRGLLPRLEGCVAVKAPFPPIPTETDDGGLTGVAINANTPASAFFPYDEELWSYWAKLVQETPAPGHDDDALVTRRTGPFHGPLAHGLACGAHLAVHNQVFWNDVGEIYEDYAWDTGSLAESWGVTDREGWAEQLGHLLRGENSPPHPEFALAARNAILEHRPGQPVDPVMWREVAAVNLRDRGGDERDVEAVLDAIGRILRYEGRFRADGLLSPDGHVTSALAYDYGRAVNFARWGLGARYAEQDEAEQAVITAGELARQAYSSWGGFSAGYILGRALRFDEESFGHMYASALSPHRILETDPESPWLHIPFANP